MTYREKAKEIVVLACQDIIDRVDEIIPDTEGVTSTIVELRIPTMTDCLDDSIPEVTITTTAYPKREVAYKIVETIQRKE